MPVYEFRCRSCGATKESLSRNPTPCNCGDIFRRVFSFSTSTDLPAHFNHSVGSYVSNSRQFNDALKQKSDEASEHFGTTINYSPVDYSDRAALGVTSEGLAETKARRKELGWKPLKSLENE